MRYASFTFDDGAINSAYKIDSILEPFRATFYITTGWVRPNNEPIYDRFNQFDHGSLENWKELANKGHDIGSHTNTHLRGSDHNCEADCFTSLQFIRQIQRPPYSISCPHHSLIKTELFDAIRTGPSEKAANSLNNLNLFELYSYEPVGKDNYEVFKSIPDNSWLILALHGIDEEGFVPIKSEELKNLVDILNNFGYEIRTIRRMILSYESGIL